MTIEKKLYNGSLYIPAVVLKAIKKGKEVTLKAGEQQGNIIICVAD